MSRLSLGQHIDLSECQSVADLAKSLVMMSEALGAPGLPPNLDADVLQPVFLDPTGGDDGGPAIVSPDPVDPDTNVTPPPVVIVGDGGTVVVGGGGGTELTAGPGVEIVTDPENSAKDLVSTDNDTATFLDYTGADNTRKNAIKWEDIPDYALGDDQVLSHSSDPGPVPMWVPSASVTGHLGKTVGIVPAATYPGDLILPGVGIVDTYVKTNPPVAASWTRDVPLSVLNISTTQIGDDRAVLLKLIDGVWFIDAVIC